MPTETETTKEEKNPKSDSATDEPEKSESEVKRDAADAAKPGSDQTTDTKSKTKSEDKSSDSSANTTNLADKDNVETEVTVEDVTEKVVKVKKIEEKKKFVSRSGEGADFWVPKTRLGRMVKEGAVSTMQAALATGLPIREPEIVDVLLPELDDEVLDVNMVQRMTDSGRRVRFSIMTVVGNGDGFVGLGSSKGKEVGPAIRKAIDNAKLNIIEIRRGCGSWECGCGGMPHTLPFTVDGKSGSTEATFRPAPRGVGLAVGDVAKHILRLSGIKDAWGFTRGQTRTTINYAKAVFGALRNTAKLKTTKQQVSDLNIISGPVEITEPIAEFAENVEDPKS